jgi:hypothetical protein
VRHLPFAVAITTGRHFCDFTGVLVAGTIAFDNNNARNQYVIAMINSNPV